MLPIVGRREAKCLSLRSCLDEHHVGGQINHNFKDGMVFFSFSLYLKALNGSLMSAGV